MKDMEKGGKYTKGRGERDDKINTSTSEEMLA